MTKHENKALARWCRHELDSDRITAMTLGYFRYHREKASIAQDEQRSSERRPVMGSLSNTCRSWLD